MDEAKALAQHQQQLMLQQQQQQQQMYLLQQFQQQQQQHQRQQQQAAMARFPSNIDAHLFGANRPLNLSQNPNPNPNSIHPLHQQQSSPRPNPNSSPQAQQQQQLLQQKVNRAPPQQQQQQQPPLAGNQMELQMAYQDAWRVCHPDFKRPFSSLEDACERLLPYHVVADYEAEEDDRILDSDTTGQIPSRSQQWDHNIAAKVAEFTATFEKQALAFNIISRKRAMGEFRSEERLMIEQALLQEEKRAFIELRSEMEREKAGREAHEANLRMAALQAEQARAESQAHAELIARAPIRANALGSQASDPSMSHEMSEQEQGVNPDEMINGWSNNATQREEREPSEDFLNDEEAEHGDTGMQEEWRESGEFDLNTR